MTASIEPTRWLGRWPAFALENASIRVVVVPELGGKIASVKSLRTGRSWLWSNPDLPVVAGRPGASYVADHDVGGWDEIVPTVHPCRLPGSPWGDGMLTDHGELWYRSWSLAEPLAKDEGGQGASLNLAVELPAPAVRFARLLRLDPDRPAFRLEYQLTNLGDEAVPYLWAAHPLFRIEDGMTIEMPAGTIARVTAAIGAAEPALHEPFAWPLAPEAGRAVKLFAELPAEAWVRLTATGGDESLRIAWRGDEVRHVGLWINEGGWSGLGAGSPPYRNLGIEPTTTAGDRLDEALAGAGAGAGGGAVRLAPGESRRWSLDVSIGGVSCDDRDESFAA
ncbi:hypothetical protein [Aquisphaera insulae]|uniref:hypothetical protein n=1 Tax=Aquisphaera insulae TaxID=2712864 RepID=UPI0013EAD6A9|nr:hypothetical protein [Aquisphaera insulae]